MTSPLKSTTLLQRVARRLGLVTFGHSLYRCFWIVGGLYAAVLLASRLSGTIPDVFQPISLAAVPVLAGLIGLLVWRRPTPVDAARAIDRYNGTKDLFLTLTMLDNAAGDYKPLVARKAESTAQRIQPVAVVPFRGIRQVVHAAGLVGLLLAGIFFLPQLDPFGKVEAAEQVQEQRRQLAETHKATEARAAALKRDDSEGSESDRVQQALDDLKSTFNNTKPTQKKQNFDKLARNQKTLGELWQKINAEKLKDLLNQTPSSQKFGGADNERLQKWTRDLQQGDTDGLKKELSDLQDGLQKLMKETDPVKKAEMARKIQKRLKDLDDFASNNVNSQPLSAALKRAMQQLEMAKNDDLSAEAMEALSQSLDLTKMELEEIAQSAKDLKELEEALKTLQMAKKLNDEEKLDGEACQACQSMSDYAELYAQMMGGMDGDGDGLGGEGIGRGGEAPEDDAVDTAFKSEQSKSAVTAGKVLLSLKTKGLSDTGEVTSEYRDLIGEVKQGISEAILQEQIPPGYHDGIKTYFDSIDAGND